MGNDQRVDIIGVPISAVNMDSCIRYVKDHLKEAVGGYICVSNAHTTVMAHEHPAYRRVQEESFLSLPDGKPLSVIGRRTVPEMDRVTGPDFMRRIFEESREMGYRHFFYGNTPENLELFLGAVRRDYPWVEIAGWEPSVFRDLTREEEQSLTERINGTRPDFIWVALGAPRQENFCYRLRGRTRGVMVAVGGAFNILAGIVAEAPRWVQDLGMEWFYRLLQEPRRLFRRYLVTNTKFLFYALTKRPVRTEEKRRMGGMARDGEKI